MKKIKNFKINLRQREILRLLKATSKVSEITPQLEDAVKQEVERLQKEIKPSAVYETVTGESMVSGLSGEIPKESVAATLYIVTINTSIGLDIRSASERGENILANVLHCLAIEALEQTINFVQRLVADEAKSEACEISARKNIDSKPVLEKIFKLLPGEKVGVSIAQQNDLLPSDKGALSPLYSSCGVMPWVPVKKQSSKSSAN
ncbi:MAG TPA: hypothetical protein DEE98_00415 [Elusimicrobia bacterium]|nr:MAG: hypothetical protein A2278_03045 [Elusimicrobia bacterium RIFOXYA12_FULL_49_49]OGS09415.1 MAG: hypothetical protein A2204_03265 [Elusimicrobia bacterium RIFOXYA1_FULL_47_7]OGS09654.1 MAG: hypothetical protein A2386_01105 [Elusimicrobia bacterium RIFOXYB1_FULL_48_9]OGS15541.1 MAG: hypothetical protein A2251_03295 [Elusimicrobia bacterium RIFOXYA2_FULL_47_53]OGS26903.1 MAG: hypothetical protein A2339_07685 [Elusimicrobia bacterium RIFOXYB12_FULL_50_12]OGS30640.1 MAG: hypothetical protein